MSQGYVILFWSGLKVYSYGPTYAQEFTTKTIEMKQVYDKLIEISPPKGNGDIM